MHQIVLQKSKQFKLPSDTVNVGNLHTVYGFLPFIQIRNPPLFTLLRKDDLFISDTSPTIIQDLIDYCFSQDCSFLKNYSSQMVAELFYYFERMGMDYNEFSAPLIFQSILTISQSVDFSPNADKYIVLLKELSITPKLLGTNYENFSETATPSYLPPISSALGSLFNSDSSDTTIIIDQFGSERVKCHRSILIAQSGFFEAFYTGHFASNEINLFNDEDTGESINFDDLSEEEKQMLIDPESQIKTRALRNILMMFYEIEPVVEKDLVIPMLDIAHKLDSEHLVLKCLKMFETSLDEESLHIVNQWLSGVEEKTDVQNMILTSADNWASQICQKTILFQNPKLQTEFSKDIETLKHFTITEEFIPNKTTHFVADSLDRKDYNFLCAVAGNCAIIKPEYLRKCIEAGCWIDEEPYLYNNCANEFDKKVQLLLKANQKNKLLKKFVFSSFNGQILLKSKTNKKNECFLKSGGGRVQDPFYANLVIVNKKSLDYSKIGGKCENYFVVDYHNLVDILLGDKPSQYHLTPEQNKRKREDEEED